MSNRHQRVSAETTTQAEQAERIKTQYEPRIRAYMERMRDCFIGNGNPCGPVEDVTCDSYQWRFVLHLGERPAADRIGTARKRDLSVDLTICESEQWDGEENGVSFRVDVSGNGGRIAAVFSPFNYTERCWANIFDAQAVEERWMLIEDLDDWAGLLEHVQEYHTKYPNG